MITKTYTCHRCQSTNIVKYGRTAKGTPRYQCKDCGIVSVLEVDDRYSPERQTQVLQAYQERGRFRGIVRVFGLDHVTVMNWVKKSPHLSPVQAEHPTCPPNGPFRSRRTVSVCRPSGASHSFMARASQTEPSSRGLSSWGRLNIVVLGRMAQATVFLPALSKF